MLIYQLKLMRTDLGDEENLDTITACCWNPGIPGYRYGYGEFQPFLEDIGIGNDSFGRFPPHGLGRAGVEKKKTVIGSKRFVQWKQPVGCLLSWTA